MKPRERILATLDHVEPDRVPLDLCATNVTGMHRITYERIAPGLGIDTPVSVLDVRTGIVALDRSARDALGVDAAMVVQRGPDPDRWRPIVEDLGDYREFRDEFGVIWQQPADQDLYFDMMGHPLTGEISVADVERFAWPDPADPHRFAGMREQARSIVEDEGRAACFGNLCTGMFELGQRVRGFEQFFVDLLADEAIAEALLDKALELKLCYWARVFEEAGDLVDVVVDTDDYGAQRSLLVSPSLWRKLVGPRLRTLNDFIHANSRAKVFMHSCGAIRDLIPDLIDCGVDILNPVQVSAARMDAAELKREFGRDVVFWGGGVDTQVTMPTGTPDQVRDETRRQMDQLMPGGGFVFAAVHNLQSDVPEANVLAMRETVLGHGGYASGG